MNISTPLAPYNRAAHTQFDLLADSTRSFAALTELTRAAKAAPTDTQLIQRIARDATAYVAAALARLEHASDLARYGAGRVADIKLRSAIFDVEEGVRQLTQPTRSPRSTTQRLARMHADAQVASMLHRHAAISAWSGVGAMFGTNPRAAEMRLSYFNTALPSDTAAEHR
jgi:hypothetical protein